MCPPFCASRSYSLPEFPAAAPTAYKSPARCLAENAAAPGTPEPVPGTAPRARARKVPTPEPGSTPKSARTIPAEKIPRESAPSRPHPQNGPPPGPIQIRIGGINLPKSIIEPTHASRRIPLIIQSVASRWMLRRTRPSDALAVRAGAPAVMPALSPQAPEDAVRPGDGYKYFQISEPISHGSSGGPIFNSKGEVIGIAVATLEEGQNLNFAVPIDYARGMVIAMGSPKALATIYEALGGNRGRFPMPESSLPGRTPSPANCGFCIPVFLYRDPFPPPT